MVRIKFESMVNQTYSKVAAKNENEVIKSQLKMKIHSKYHCANEIDK